jgi:polysaccharide deacetylase
MTIATSCDADNVPASTAAPRGLARDQTPQFVGIGWDDNGDAEGVSWALSLHTRTGGHASFFVNSVYGSSDAVRRTWSQALADGHELGNHTACHQRNPEGHTFTVGEWKREIQGCTDFLTTLGGVMHGALICGFRAPYLEYDDEALTAVAELGFDYDCSIEEGHEAEQDGSNYYWPYTLDNLSPGHAVWAGRMHPKGSIKLTPHAGLWELPVYALIAPPDDECAEYGVPVGFRKRLHDRQSLLDPATGKITGFDYNLWAPVTEEGFAMTKTEFLATVKYSFDQHYAGNRTPFLLGAHTAFYVDEWNQNAPGTPLAADRRAAMEELLAYVTSKAGVRVVSHKQLLDWLRNPKAL